MPTAELVFLIDVDDTLLDNDRFVADLTSRLDQAFGEVERMRYWEIYERLRAKLGYADYLGTLQEFRLGNTNETELLQMSGFLLEYPFDQLVYPGALATLEHLNKMGTTVVLSDGDIVFQPRKIRRAGLWDAVGGRVLIYLHKDRMLAEVERRFPARHYAMLDDKPQLLASAKRQLGDQLTTVFVRQGHYAAQSEGAQISPAPDASVRQIADLIDFGPPDFGTADIGRSE
ncbi:HAD family hydrolase [Pseudaminobacter soli (ex Li et al. 2025)]|uniref:Haloacid dehalogenase n=1 Tax=Pseudaminobacter soli (ex Li et al. 2025) TaxID=1295366 RepID=A0A2P7SCZ6_9HYPH|nr:HAD family hydrolase [Mesorhizobium soli]PSJ60374.1 haloacid dehalogenase [Mesorhizobium soli]